MNNVSRSTSSLYLVGWDVWAQLMQDCIVLITPLVLGLSSSHVTVCLQENNVPWFQHHSTGVAVIVSFLLMSFKYILSTCLIEHLRKMLLEHDNKVIDTHNASFLYCGEMEVYWEPQTVPKQKVMWAIARDCIPCSIVSLN